MGGVDMFVWSDRKSQLDDKERLEQIIGSSDGLNQRAMGLFPHPKEEAPRRVDFASQIKCRQLLVNIEGNEETCVLRLISQRNKSRAAVLILRGRVLGCIYGRKEHDGNLIQLMGQEAFQRVRLEILSSDTIIDTYKVDDKTAIAASAIFHGELYQPHSTETVKETLDFSLNHLLESSMPGTIVLNENIDNAAIIYIFKGKIHGVFSFEEGWLDNSREAIEKLFLKLGHPEVQASKLLACNIWELKQFTFSVTGLEETPLSASHSQLPVSSGVDYNELEHLRNDKQEHGLSATLKDREREREEPTRFVPGSSNNRVSQSYWKNKNENL
jgi:hypothetical protein